MPDLGAYIRPGPIYDLGLYTGGYSNVTPAILSTAPNILDLLLQETVPPVFLRVAKASVLFSRLLGNTTKGNNENVHFLCSRLLSLVDWHDPRQAPGGGGPLVER